MRILAFLVLISAVAIAACAAYFSIIGLKLLFVGSGISIVVMGIALEVGKFISATFLKQKWDSIDWFLKTYLILATLVLMGITSIGIYGYLSAGYNATAIKVQSYEQQIQSNIKKIEELKAENIKLSADVVNQNDIELINKNKADFTAQQLKLIESKEAKLKEVRNNNTADKKSSDDMAAAKAALDAEKVNTDSEINKEIKQIELINGRLALLDKEVNTWINLGDQGYFKVNGIDKAREVKKQQEGERAQIDSQIKDRQSKIESLREQYRKEVDKYNVRIANIESRLASQTAFNEQAIKSLETEILEIRHNMDEYNKGAELAIKEQIEKKQTILNKNKTHVQENENTVQQLLATNDQIKEQIIHTDVGTFKFVASSFGLTLDKTVNYFIGAIMLVFDPLAVCLVLCFNFLIKDIANKNKLTYPPELQEENINIKPQPTPVPSTPDSIEPMKSSEIIFGQKKEKPKHPPAEGEVKRLEDILEAQRKEKAERDAKKN